MITRKELDAKINEEKERLFRNTLKHTEETIDDYLFKSVNYKINCVTLTSWYALELLSGSSYSTLGYYNKGGEVFSDLLVLVSVPTEVIDVMYEKYSKAGYSVLKDDSCFEDVEGSVKLVIYTDDNTYREQKKIFDENGGHFINRKSEESSYLHTEVNSPVFNSKKHWWEFWK